MDTNQPKTQPQSTLAVLEKSRELHLLLSKVTLDENILPRVYRLTVGKPVTDHSQLIYESLAVANTLDLYDKDLLDERLKYQTIAKREVTKLLAALRIMYSISEMDSDKMRVLLDKTIEVERFLKKWIESDKHRVGITLNIVKKDIIDTKVFDRQISTRDLFETKKHVDFDMLVKDVRTQGTVAAINHLTGRPMYVPPAESLNKAPIPPPVYVVKSDEQKEKELRQQVIDFSKVAKEIPDPPKVVRTPTDFVVTPTEIKAEPTREPVIITVRDKPIIVPDDRREPAPPYDRNRESPPSPDVAISSGTPELVTEDPIKEEETPVCQNSTAPSSQETDPTSATSPTSNTTTEASEPSAATPQELPQLTTIISQPSSAAESTTAG